MVISLRSTQGIVIAVHDRDTEGNDEGEKTRKKNERAFKKLKKALPIAYGESPNYALEALESSPAPTDWGKTLQNLNETREKAIAYLAETMKSVKLFPLPVEKGFSQVYFREETGLQFSRKEPRKMFEIVPASVLTTDQLFCAASYVQKAIAGGNNQ